jgi:hypothetical protein
MNPLTLTLSPLGRGEGIFPELHNPDGCSFGRSRDMMIGVIAGGLSQYWTHPASGKGWKGQNLTRIELTPTSSELIPLRIELNPSSSELIRLSSQLTPASSELIPSRIEFCPTSKEFFPVSSEFFPASKELLP